MDEPTAGDKVIALVKSDKDLYQRGEVLEYEGAHLFNSANGPRWILWNQKRRKTVEVLAKHFALYRRKGVSVDKIVIAKAGDMAKLQAAMIEPVTTFDTGHTREQEIEQLRAELQTALQDKADVEIERDVAVFELRRLFKCANKAKREAVSAFLKYGKHEPECSAAHWFRPEGKKCDCGFDELNEAMRF